ncbi:MAG: DUF5050 domain-containing protein [Ruminococcaceae bacterium]|nr:DUF5050 domain-containing protein [Oscillospiraceae bacterium]
MILWYNNTSGICASVKPFNTIGAKGVTMKRTILIVISAIFVLSCFSCTRQELPYLSEEMTKNDGFSQVYSYTPTDDGLENVIFSGVYMASNDLYYNDGNMYLCSADMYYKIDLETGRLTTLCKDPVCNHKTWECPLHGQTSYFYVFGKDFISRQYTLIGGERLLTLNHFDIEKSVRKVLHNFNMNSSKLIENRTLYNDELLFVDVIKDEKTEEYIYSLCAVNIRTGKKRVMVRDAWRITPLMADEGGVYYSDLKEQYYFYARNNDLDDREILPFYAVAFYLVGDKIIYEDKDGCLIYSDRDGKNKINLNIKGVDDFFVTDNYVYYRYEGKTNIGKMLTRTGPGKTEEVTIELNMNSIYRCSHDGSNVEEVIRFHDGEPLEAGETVYYSQNMFILSGYYYTGLLSYTMGEDGYLTGDRGDDKCRNYLRINIETGEKYIIKVPNIYVNH